MKNETVFTLNKKEIPRIAIGTWGWGKGLNGSNMIFGSTPHKETLLQAFGILYDAGYYMWDTAAVYGWGSSEKILGEFIRDCDKEKLIISTKFSPGDSFQAYEIAGMLNGSKKRLCGLTPDIYWLEKPGFFEKTLEAFSVLRKERVIGGIGLSNCNSNQLEKAKKLLMLNGCKISGVQNHYSLVHRRDESNGVMDWCRRNNVPYFACMPLEQGALSGQYSFKQPLPLLSRRGMVFGPLKMKKAEPLINKLAEIGARYEISPAATAILWTAEKGAIPIVGVTKLSHAEELVKIKNLHLTQDEMMQLDNISAGVNINTTASWERN